MCGIQVTEKGELQKHGRQCELFKMSYSDIFRLIDQYSYTGGASAEPQQLMNLINVLNLARWDLKDRIEGGREEDVKGVNMPDFDIGDEEEEKKVDLGKQDSWQL
jgi:hypothetical protein